jgi:hypothetical protein
MNSQQQPEFTLNYLRELIEEEGHAESTADSMAKYGF